MKQPAVNKRNARKGEYKKVIETIYSTGKCPFCKENFLYHKKPILKKTKQWFITENSWPYKNAKRHFLILGEKHKEQFSELTSADLKQISQLINWAIQEYAIRGGAVAMRFGPTEYTGASVAHIHFHLLSPERTKTKTLKLQFPIG